MTITESEVAYLISQSYIPKGFNSTYVIDLDGAFRKLYIFRTGGRVTLTLTFGAIVLDKTMLEIVP